MHIYDIYKYPYIYTDVYGTLVWDGSGSPVHCLSTWGAEKAPDNTLIHLARKCGFLDLLLILLLLSLLLLLVRKRQHFYVHRAQFVDK